MASITGGIATEKKHDRRFRVILRIHCNEKLFYASLLCVFLMPADALAIHTKKPLTGRPAGWIHFFDRPGGDTGTLSGFLWLHDYALPCRSCACARNGEITRESCYG